MREMHTSKGKGREYTKMKNWKTDESESFQSNL